MRSSAIAVTVLCCSFFLLLSCDGGRGRGDGMGLLGNDESINTGNRAPSADAGSDQAVVTGTVVSLSGNSSSDPDGDLLSYAWSFISIPYGSVAQFSSALAKYPTFIVDKAGAYQIQLIVNDGSLNSTADTVTVTATASVGNSTPIAYAGPDQTVKTGANVTLDASGSIDVDGDPMTYTWLFTSIPGASTAVISSVNATNPSFIADKDGSYIIQLVVNDGQVDSIADSVTVISATPVLVHVPDTGQIANYTDTLGEDSDYTIHPPLYTDNGNGTVTDTVTGLMWQQLDDGSTHNWTAAMSYCEDLALGGHLDWRLPDNRELIGIIDYGANNPVIDTIVFPYTKSSNYWTSTEYGLDPTSARNVIFDNGVNDSSRTEKTNTHYVRCVRGTQSMPVLTDNGDETITDETTSLVWQKLDDNVQRKWTNALSYCEDLSLAGQTDWRLPNIKELMSLTDYRFWPRAIDTSYFPRVITTLSMPRYWSSTTLPSNANHGLAVSFVPGYVGNLSKASQWYVRCVREGQ